MKHYERKNYICYVLKLKEAMAEGRTDDDRQTALEAVVACIAQSAGLQRYEHMSEVQTTSESHFFTRDFVNRLDPVEFAEALACPFWLKRYRSVIPEAERVWMMECAMAIAYRLGLQVPYMGVVSENFSKLRFVRPVSGRFFPDDVNQYADDAQRLLWLSRIASAGFSADAVRQSAIEHAARLTGHISVQAANREAGRANLSATLQKHIEANPSAILQEMVDNGWGFFNSPGQDWRREACKALRVLETMEDMEP